MTETFSLPATTVDPGVSDEWRNDLHNLIQNEIARSAVTYFRGEIARVDGAFVDVRRLYKIGPEQPDPPHDEMLYPVVSGPYGLAVGDLVDCLQLPIGGVIVLRRARGGDETMNDVVPRDGSRGFTDYPMLPDSGQTNDRHPAKKGQVDAADARAQNARDAADNARTVADGADARAVNARAAADNARDAADTAQRTANNRVPLTGATITGNTYVKAEFSADKYFVYFGGWKQIKRDAQGYLWA